MIENVCWKKKTLLGILMTDSPHFLSGESPAIHPLSIPAYLFRIPAGLGSTSAHTGQQSTAYPQVVTVSQGSKNKHGKMWKKRFGFTKHQPWTFDMNAHVKHAIKMHFKLSRSISQVVVNCFYRC